MQSNNSGHMRFMAKVLDAYRYGGSERPTVLLRHTLARLPARLPASFHGPLLISDQVRSVVVRARVRPGVSSCQFWKARHGSYRE